MRFALSLTIGQGPVALLFDFRERENNVIYLRIICKLNIGPGKKQRATTVGQNYVPNRWLLYLLCVGGFRWFGDGSNSWFGASQQPLG